MFIGTEVTDVNHSKLNQTFFLCPFDDTFIERAFKHAGEEGKDVEAHILPPLA
jgi:hypothetical protein